MLVLTGGVCLDGTSVQLQELFPEVLPRHQVDEEVTTEVEVVDLLEHFLDEDSSLRDLGVEEQQDLVAEPDDGQGGLQDEQRQRHHQQEDHHLHLRRLQTMGVVPGGLTEQRVDYIRIGGFSFIYRVD